MNGAEILHDIDHAASKLRYGYILKESAALAKTSVHRCPRRWSERLRSRPWRRFKWVTNIIPDQSAFIVGEYLVAHPKTMAKIKIAVERFT